MEPNEEVLLEAKCDSKLINFYKIVLIIVEVVLLLIILIKPNIFKTSICLTLMIILGVIIWGIISDLKNILLVITNKLIRYRNEFGFMTNISIKDVSSVSTKQGYPFVAIKAYIDKIVLINVEKKEEIYNTITSLLAKK